jgi:hypothetical protein
MATLTPFSYHEVIEACGEPGCPICRLGNRSAERYLAALIYDSVNDVPTRTKLREALGFCHEHTWRAPEAGESAPLGLAFIYRDLLNTLNKRLTAASYQSKGPAFWQQLRGAPTASSAAQQLGVATNCPACERRAEMEGLAVTAVTQSLTHHDERMKTALAQSQGICLPHLRQALDNAGSQVAFDALAAISRAHMETLIAQLDEFIRKNDHRFHHEPFNDEADSWLRAIRLVAGSE